MYGTRGSTVGKEIAITFFSYIFRVIPKMVPEVPLFSTEHSKGKYWLFLKN